MNCLVIMPFSSEFDPVFAAVRNGTISGTANKAQCYWLKDVKAAGRITDDIVRGLSESTFCIADLTGNKPNVMWEAGFAMAHEKPIILIGQNIKKVPFDLKGHRVLEYHIENLDKLSLEVEEAVKQTVLRISSMQVRWLPAHLYWLGHDLARAIRLAQFEPQEKFEIKQNLLGALYHLGKIHLQADHSRMLILRALAAVDGIKENNPLDQQALVGWIAQAKNDIGGLLEKVQHNFQGYPSPEERDAFFAEAKAANNSNN